VLLRAGRVVEPHVLADEPGRLDGCQANKKFS
jgi:hypothetical protein